MNPDPETIEDIHQQIQVLMMGHLDGELDESGERRMREHVDGCAACAAELVKYHRLQDLARNVRLQEPGDAEWERFHRELFTSLERHSAAWMVTGGVFLVLGYLLYAELLYAGLPLLVRIGIAVAALGVVVLFFSVWRERRRTRRFDRYREIRR
jgi:anti-sigma factor RsiW